MKLDDGLSFFNGQPMITRNPAVMFVDFPVAQLPVVELAGLDADPAHELFGGNVRFVLPVPHVIDDGVTGLMGNPASV